MTPPIDFTAPPIDFTAGAPVAGAAEPAWVHGALGEPPIQVHWRDDHTVILRQSKTTSFEAPFLFLLFGNHRAALFDTGATQDPDVFPVARTVDRLLDNWLARHPRDSYPLVVAHTHSHRDHRAGDAQFAGRIETTVVGLDLQDVTDFFGFDSWPDQVVSFDLGGRVLEVVGIPGHHPTSIAVFDPWTGLLLTGDTVYPGRLYVSDQPAFAASLDRLIELVAARRVTGLAGCHIEMTRSAGKDYPLGSRFQPDEPPLVMDPRRLHDVRAAGHAAVKRGPSVHDDFILWHRAQPRLVATHLLRRMRRRLLR